LVKSDYIGYGIVDGPSQKKNAFLQPPACSAREAGEVCDIGQGAGIIELYEGERKFDT
jgi:hypothetical protein